MTPVDFLKQLGLCDTSHGVRIPYYDEGGQTIAVYYQLHLANELRFVLGKGLQSVALRFVEACRSPLAPLLLIVAGNRTAGHSGTAARQQ